MRLFIIAFVLLFCSSAFALDQQEESILAGLSNCITKQCKSDETRVYALMEFVHDRVKPKEGEDPYKQISDLERIQTGVGWCNHQAKIFMHLAYYQEIKTRLIYLMNDDGTASPHTIAEWWNGKEWIIADPLFMIYGISREEIRQSVGWDDIPYSFFRQKFPLIKDRPDEWLRCYINEPQIIFEYNPLPN